MELAVYAVHSVFGEQSWFARHDRYSVESLAAAREHERRLNADDSYYQHKLLTFGGVAADEARPELTLIQGEAT